MPHSVQNAFLGIWKTGLAKFSPNRTVDFEKYRKYDSTENSRVYSKSTTSGRIGTVLLSEIRLSEIQLCALHQRACQCSQVALTCLIRFHISNYYYFFYESAYIEWKTTTTTTKNTVDYKGRVGAIKLGRRGEVRSPGQWSRDEGDHHAPWGREERLCACVCVCVREREPESV